MITTRRIRKVTRKALDRLGITLVEYYDEKGEQIDLEWEEFPLVVERMLDDEKLFDRVIEWCIDRATEGTVVEEWIEQRVGVPENPDDDENDGSFRTPGDRKETA